MKPCFILNKIWKQELVASTPVNRFSLMKEPPTKPNNTEKFYLGYHFKLIFNHFSHTISVYISKIKIQVISHLIAKSRNFGVLIVPEKFLPKFWLKMPGFQMVSLNWMDTTKHNFLIYFTWRNFAFLQKKLPLW